MKYTDLVLLRPSAQRYFLDTLIIIFISLTLSEHGTITIHKIYRSR